MAYTKLTLRAIGKLREAAVYWATGGKVIETRPMTTLQLLIEPAKAKKEESAFEVWEETGTL